MNRCRTVAGAALLLASCISFGAPRTFHSSATAGQSSQNVVFADVTGNGAEPIVLVAGVLGPALVRMTSCGDSCLQPAQSVPIPDVVEHLAVADFDGDTIDDVVVTGTTVRVYFGSAGDGTRPPGLAATDFVPVASVSWIDLPGEVVADDFDGDGDADIGLWGGTVDAGGTVTIRYLNIAGDGAGGFAPAVSLFTHSPGEREVAGGLGMGDVDGDGRPEALVGVVNGDTAQTTITIVGAAGVEGSFIYTGLDKITAAGDIDGDTRDDLATTTELPVAGLSARIHLFRSTGTSFVPFDPDNPTLDSGAGSIGDVVLRDVDEDGHADVVATGYDPSSADPGSLLSWLGTDNGAFFRTETPAGPQPHAIAFGDVGGGPSHDVVVDNRNTENAPITLLANRSFLLP